jgi:hypothetical protein
MLMVLFVFMIAAAGAFACIDSSLVGAALALKPSSVAVVECNQRPFLSAE